jgi:hypothetical protein
MAKTKLNSAMKTLRGRVGDVVFKQYRYGVVVSKVPRMDQVKPSVAQLEHQGRVRAAGRFYHEVRADPQLRAKFSRIAKRRGIPLSAVTLQEFLKRTAAAPAAGRPGRQRPGKAS